MIGQSSRSAEPDRAVAAPDLATGRDILEQLGPCIGRAGARAVPQPPAWPDYGPRAFTLPQLLAARRLASHAQHPWSVPGLDVVESGLAVRVRPQFGSPWRESICALGEGDTLPEELLRHLVVIAGDHSYRDEWPHLDEAGHIRGVANLDPATALLWREADEPIPVVRTTWAIGRGEATLIVYEPGRASPGRGADATPGRALRCTTPLAGSLEGLARASRALPTARYGFSTVAVLFGLLAALHDVAVALRVALPLAAGAARE